MKFQALGALALLVPLAACSPSNSDPDVNAIDSGTGGNDAQTGMDVLASADAQPANDVPAGRDDGPGADVPMGACGTGRPDLSALPGAEGLVIGGDGTMYFSQDGAIGRMRPGMAAETSWVTLPTEASTVFGLAISAARHTLYAASPSAMRIYTIDLALPTPAAVALAFDAGQANGLTVGPDGALYYSDSAADAVFRVDAAGARTQVSTGSFNGANGVAFGPDGAMYVDNYGDGTLTRVTLTGGMESARTTVAMNLGSPDGIAFDAAGRIYVTDNAAGRLIRLAADGTGMTVLRMDLRGAANVEFGAGALNCRDIYVAGDSIYRIEGDAAGAMVPWH